jgi:predicted metal-dependent hydrolase
MSKRERISDFVSSMEGGSAGEKNYYAAFFRLWNEQRYYEAHDVLEQLWLEETNTETARFFQALIQAAGAFVHLQKNFEHPLHAKHSRRLRPATRLFALALENLDRLPDRFRELDLVSFRELLEKTRSRIIDSRFETNPWSPDHAPQLRVVHDPVQKQSMGED